MHNTLLKDFLVLTALSLFLSACLPAAIDPCQRINDVPAVGCNTGFSPQDAAKHTGQEISMGDPIDPMIISAIEILPYTNALAKFFNKNVTSMQSFKLQGEDEVSYPLPVFTFPEMNDKEQKEAAKEMIEALDTDGISYQIEVGIGPDPYSVLEAAGTKPETVILGFDPQYQNSYTTEREVLLPVKYPLSNGSSAAIFSIDASDINVKDFPKADIAYSIAPYKNTMEQTLVLTSELGEIGYVVPSPMYGEVDIEKLETEVHEINPTTAVWIEEMTLNDIKKLLGTNYSLYMSANAPEDGIYQVLVAQSP